jgi:hypothetical protein
LRAATISGGLQFVEPGLQARQGVGQFLGRDAVLARGDHHCLDPRLEFGEPARVEFQPLAVTRQGMARFGQLDARAVEQLGRLTQGRVVVDEVAHLPDCLIDQLGGRPALLEQRQRGVDAFDQAHRVRQATMLGIVLDPLRRIEGQRGQFLDLPFEQVALAPHRLDVARGLLPRLVQRAPVVVADGNLARDVGQARLGIEKTALRVGLEQREMSVLAMDVDQQFADLAQLAEGGRQPIDVGARAAAGFDDAAQQQCFVRFVVVGAQPCTHRVARADFLQVELGSDLRPLRADAHQCRIAALAQRQRQRVDQDGLAGTGLAGERAEAGIEVELEAVDDDEVADEQAAQHRCVVQCLGVALQCSFSRSMAK